VAKLERRWIFDPESTGSNPVAPTLAHVTQLEECFATNKVVTGSNPVVGSRAGIAKLARQRASNPSSGVQIPLPAPGRRGPVRQGTRLIIGVASDKRKVVGSNPTASTVEAWRNWLAQHLAKVSGSKAVWVQVPPLPPPAQWSSWKDPRLQIGETGVRVSPGPLGDVAQPAAHPSCKRANGGSSPPVTLRTCSSKAESVIPTRWGL
jgi:hypothetical protein